jgi:hypothetical protein
MAKAKSAQLEKEKALVARRHLRQPASAGEEGAVASTAAAPVSPASKATAKAQAPKAKGLLAVLSSTPAEPSKGKGGPPGRGPPPPI